MKKAIAVATALVLVGIGAPAAPTASQILDATGVRGGLVVHVGCGDGKLTAALRASPSFVVQGLDPDPANIRKARAHIRSLGLYGPVSVRQWSGPTLPYADNLVNLVVAEDLGRVPMTEVMRVLAPGGVAYVAKGKAWTLTRKPWPQQIDQWSHFLHDSTNNAVAHDTVVGPPRRLQWTAGPPWCRSHEFISSFCALVAAGGRVYYVMDLAPAGVTARGVPEKWTLIARDAFNGVLLWQRPLPKWRGAEWRSTAMRGRPPSVPRRMVASGDTLYATLSHEGPLEVIAGATGKTLRKLPGTEGTQEIVLTGTTLVLRLAPSKDRPGRISAYDARSGKPLWKVEARRYLPQSLAADQRRVIFSDGAQTTCLAVANGKFLWRAPDLGEPPQPKEKPRPGAKPRRRRRGQKTFILYRDTVLVTDGSRLVARDAATGKLRWATRTGGSAMRGHDLFVARGLAWHAAKGGIAGYDLATGKVVKTINPAKAYSRGHHLRCYRAKATDRYLITQFRGAEFISLTDQNHSQNDWTRGPCRYGVMPANGMLYVPPNQCFCYPGAMMEGFNAYTTASDATLAAIGSGPQGNRLVRGPAYGKVEATKADPQDWPLYRHDSRRTGASATTLAGEPTPLWQTRLPGRLTPPVAVGDRVFVASKDTHTVYALDAGSGKVAWSFVADGAVDSPPSFYRGRLVFGCADGWVYCLRASDGVLAWKFRAAPAERLIVDGSRVESAWRVHGSVVIHDGLVYCAAGRSSFLDGGIFLYALRPETGEVVHQGRFHTAMATRKDAEGKPFVPAFHIEGTRSDILVAEGGYIYLDQMKFSPDLKVQDTPYVPHTRDEKTTGMNIAGKPYVAPNPYLAKGYASAAALGVWRGHMGDRIVGLHLFTTGGFLDDSWWNRTFWMYSKTWPGYQMAHLAPKAGQILVIGPQMTYAVQAYPTRNIHSPMFVPATKGYLLVADRNDNEPVLDHRAWGRDKGIGFSRKAPPVWFRWVPVRMRALVLAGEKLVGIGPPDALDPKDPLLHLEGRDGSVLCVFAAKDGRKLLERKLPFAPVFDGLIAARGKLVLTTADGRVVAFAAAR